MKSFICFLLTIATLISSPMAYAKGKKAESTPKPTPKRTVVKSISSDHITIDTGVFTKNFKLNDHTVYTYQGRKVPQSDVKPGMRVTVTPAFDNLFAALVAASDAPVPAATTPAKKK